VNQPFSTLPVEQAITLPGRFRGLLPKLGLLLLSLLAASGLGEIGLRIFYREPRLQTADAANLGYRYHAELGWFPVPNSKTRITASRTITASHNTQGFRGPEPAASGKPRIMFLGDSLVWGFDVEAGERFTEKLQARHPELSVDNLGVCGYGTDQEFLLLQKQFAKYKPQLVFLVICGDNDNEDNAWNFRGGYYKPYFRLEQGHLKLHGVPVPKSANTFFSQHKFVSHSLLIRALVRACYRFKAPPPVKNPDPPTGVLLLEMRKYVLERGALFAVGLQHSNRELEQFLRNFRIPYVDLSTTNSAHTYPSFGNHWTPDGHTFVAGRIDEFLGKKRAGK